MGQKYLQKLSPKAQDILKTKTINEKLAVKEWIPLLEELTGFDNIIESQYAKAKTHRTITFVCMIIFIVGGIFVGAVAENVIIFAAGVPIGILFLILTLRINTKMNELKKEDLEDDFKMTILPLLRDLYQDIRDKGKVRISFDMNSVIQKENITNNERLREIKGKMIKTDYHKHCGSLFIPLLNGMNLIVGLIKDYSCFKHSYWKKSSSGKMKYKTKKKWKQLVTVVTTLKTGEDNINLSPREIERLAQEEKVKQGIKGSDRVLTLIRKFKFKTVEDNPKDIIEPNVIINMLMRLCNALAT